MRGRVLRKEKEIAWKLWHLFTDFPTDWIWC